MEIFSFILQTNSNKGTKHKKMPLETAENIYKLSASPERKTFYPPMARAVIDDNRIIKHFTTYQVHSQTSLICLSKMLFSGNTFISFKIN